MEGIPFWSYVNAALCLVIVVAVIVYVIWILYRHYRRRTPVLPEPQVDPDYP